MSRWRKIAMALAGLGAGAALGAVPLPAEAAGPPFTWSQWQSVNPDSGWKITAGDYTGDSRYDVMAYHNNGSVWVARNIGGDFGNWVRWSTVAPAAGWSFDSGQYAGDGKHDLVGYHPSNGTIWVGRNG